MTEVRGQPAGFTLLEVLVAFIIAALALGLLFQGGIGGLLTARIAGRYGEALSRAESHLAEATAGPTLTAGDSSGDGGRRFPLAGADPAHRHGAGGRHDQAGAGAVRGRRAGKLGGDGRTRAVTLQTQRTATAPAPPP